MKYTIKDNYLEIEDFISLQTYLLDPNFPRFPWIWSKIILNNEDKYREIPRAIHRPLEEDGDDI